MSFPLGKPILVMVAVALCGGGAILFRAELPRKDLVFWVFYDPNFRAYEPLIPAFKREIGKSVDLKIVQERAEQVRLEGIFSTDAAVPDTPDLVEVEINRIGKFFRPPTGEVGFAPLNDLLKRDRLYDQIVETRYAPWSKEGVIFGIPGDLHPCTITYRDDLFREAGVDLPAAKTWPQFQEACLRFNAYWSSRGETHRHAMELNAGSPEDVYKMLLQRHVNLVDDYNRVYLNDPKVANTVAFVAGCLDGPRKFAGSTSGGEEALKLDLRQGNLCAFITPDWRAADLKRIAGPDFAGRLRMMPLPVFDPGDAPTSTWGGTMVGILRNSPNREAAWALAKRLYFDPQTLIERHARTGILPPIISIWSQPEFHQPDPFFGGQKIDELFIDLARQLPAAYVTPARTLSMLYLNDVFRKVRGYVAAHGPDGLEAACQRWLDAASEDLKKRMKQWEF